MDSFDNALASMKDTVENSEVFEKMKEGVSLTHEQLKKILETKIKIHKEISEFLTINDIDDFARQMLDLGTEYKYKYLAKWGEQLLSQTMMFDMEALGETLDEFPKIINDIQDLI